MKFFNRYLLTFGLAVSGLTFTNAQQLKGVCGCTMHELGIISERIDENKRWLSENGTVRTGAIRYIPIRFTIVKTGNGTGGVNEKNVLRALCRLNADYQDQDVQFYLKDEFKYINNDLLYNDPRANSASNIMNNNKDSKALNIFIVNDIKSDGEGNVLGYYDPQRDLVVLRISEMNGNTYTPSHEVGHFFSLNHTFYGWECEPWNVNTHGSQVTQTALDCSPWIPIELVNKSNCDVAGDKICDTPPDYMFGFGWPSDCRPFSTKVYDRNNDQVIPQQNNQMGYFFGCGDYVFTGGQKNVITADINSTRRNYLKNTYAPVATSIGEVNNPYPADSIEQDRTKAISLTWTPVDGATNYIVEYGPSRTFNEAQTKRAITNTNSFELPANTIASNIYYYWRVTPYNPSTTCYSSNKYHVFRATNMVSINSLDNSLSWNVTPNPISVGQRMTIHFDAPQSMKLDISVIDVYGNTVNEWIGNAINKGESTIDLNMSNLPSGVYFVYAKSEKGTAVRKMIIQ